MSCSTKVWPAGSTRPAIVGLVLTVILLAVLADVLIRVIQRGSLPWARKQQPA